MIMNPANSFLKRMERFFHSTATLRRVGFPNVVILILLISLCGASSPGSIPPDNGAQVLLAAARNATAWAQVSAQVDDLDRHVREQGGHPVDYHATVEQYWAGNGNIDIKMDLTYTGPPYTGQEFHSEYVLANGRHLLKESDHVQLATSPEHIEIWRKLHRCDEATGGFLNGSFDMPGPEYPSIFDLASQGSLRLRPDMETIDGIACDVLESTTPKGMAILWIAPSKGNNLAKYQFDKTPDEHYKAFSVLFDQPKYMQIGNTIILSGGHFESHWTPADGSGNAAHDEEVTIQRTSVDLTPKFDDPKMFVTGSTPDIANGTNVFLEEDLKSGIRYVWKDGEAVPFRDDTVLTSILQEASRYRNAMDSTSSETTSAAGTDTATALMVPPAENRPPASIWFPIAGMGVGFLMLAGAVISLARLRRASGKI